MKLNSFLAVGEGTSQSSASWSNNLRASLLNRWRWLERVLLIQQVTNHKPNSVITNLSYGRMVGGSSGWRRSSSQQEEWRWLCWHGRQTAEDLCRSVRCSGIDESNDIWLNWRLCMTLWWSGSKGDGWWSCLKLITQLTISDVIFFARIFSVLFLLYLYDISIKYM